ncbi:carbohydrate binding domain-containing protein [Amycolatopsis halotolerans]|uniref:Carbohydrate binding domain-containing protein n=1 Tax=Amycolatopsis halotolerans TaxID=330083 RepID=A0ABV7QF74_9PSEU
MAAPYEDEAISFNAGVNNFDDYWVSVATRRIETASTSRGRQYELDTVQTGEYHATYDNRDGALTPGNTASPYSPNVVPYRPIRKRMQYPATQNVLLVNQASSGEAATVGAFSAPVAPGGTMNFVYGAYGNPVVTASATAFQGAQVFQTSIPASPITGAALIFMTNASIVPGQPHTFSVYVRTPTGTAALSVAAAITWVDTNANFISQSLGTATSLPVASSTWTRITVTATPPANAGGAWFGIAGQNSPAAACTLQCDAAQLEYASAATAYVKPNTWYPMFKGFVERWPQRWDQSGLFRKVDITAVDHFGYLSQTILKPPFYADMLATNTTYPLRFFYTFDVGQLAIHVNDLSHNRGAAPVAYSWYGAGSLTFGNAITETFKANADTVSGGGFLGGANSVATFNNPSDPAGSNLYMAGTYIDLTSGTGYTPPTGDGSGWYTRIIAFRCPAIKAWYQWLWNWENAGYTYTSDLAFYIDHTSGYLSFAGIAGFGANQVTDGNWHMATVRVNTSTGQVATWMDGVEMPTGSTTVSGVTTLPGNSDSIGTAVTNGSQQVVNGFTGDVAFVAEFAGYLDTTTLSNLFTSWRAAWNNESSANRYSRVLGWVGFNALSVVPSSPSTVAMGPATDITAGGQAAGTYSPTTGTDAQTALQNIATTENGNHFVAANGTLTFQSRSSRYGAQTPSIVFGENQSGGEIPYEDVKYDYDMTRVANDVQITQYVNNSVFEAFAPTSQQQYGTRTLTRTINSLDPLECNDASNWFTYRYGNPDYRMQTLRIHVSANPAAWATMLTLECGTKARVMRRSLEQTMTWDGFVERISWTIDYAQNEVFADLEMSPADLSQFWILAALHAATTASVTAGATQVTLSPLPDAATIPFTSHIPGKSCVVSQLSNPGFENGLSPWGVNGGTLVQSSTTRVTGQYAAQITPNGTSSQGNIASEFTPVTAGAQVSASAWVWFTSAVTQYSTSVTWYNASNAFISTTNAFTSVPAGQWTKVQNTFTAPAGAVSAVLVPTLAGTPPSSNIWRVDDCSIGTVSTAASTSITPIALTLRVGAGTSVQEDLLVNKITTTGGTQVNYPNGNPEPGAYIGYTSVTITFAFPLANAHPAGTQVSEVLPASMTDPTSHDIDANVGTTTIIGY